MLLEVKHETWHLLQKTVKSARIWCLVQKAVPYRFMKIAISTTARKEFDLRRHFELANTLFLYCRTLNRDIFRFPLYSIACCAICLNKNPSLQRSYAFTHIQHKKKRNVVFRNALTSE